MMYDFIECTTPQRPLTPEQVYSPDYWHRCAERMRARAMATADTASAARYGRCAADFDRLAECAAALLAADAPC